MSERMESFGAEQIALAIAERDALRAVVAEMQAKLDKAKQQRDEWERRARELETIAWDRL